MDYINRNQEEQLLELVEADQPNKDVLLVEGARQVGKTTTIEQILSRVEPVRISVNLEKESLLRSEIDACRQFSEFEDLLLHKLDFDPNERSILFIDEAQESLKLGQFVRFMKESWRRTTVILSGSI